MRIAPVGALLGMLVLASAAGAQTSGLKNLPPIVPSEGELTKLVGVALRQTSRGGEVCGEYFRFSGVPKDTSKVGMLTFIYDVRDTSANVEHSSISIMGTDKIEVHMVNSRRTPMVHHIRMGGPVHPWYEIEMSEKDLAASMSCLKYSKIVRL